MSPPVVMGVGAGVASAGGAMVTGTVTDAGAYRGTAALLPVLASRLLCSMAQQGRRAMATTAHCNREDTLMDLPSCNGCLRPAVKKQDSDVIRSVSEGKDRAAAPAGAGVQRHTVGAARLGTVFAL